MLAGALLTQTTQFVAPSMMSFQRSADVLVILIIGGTARLYGAFVGAFVFLFLRDWLAALSPVYWYFWIGLLLVIVVSFFRKGILPSVEAVVAAFARTMAHAGGAMSDVILQTRDLHMAFGGLIVFDSLNFALRRGERHAIIGPNGAGKTTFVSLVTGLLQPVSGDVSAQRRRHHRNFAAAARQGRHRADLSDQHAVSRAQPAGIGRARAVRARRQGASLATCALPGKPD